MILGGGGGGEGRWAELKSEIQWRIRPDVTRPCPPCCPDDNISVHVPANTQFHFVGKGFAGAEACAPVVFGRILHTSPKLSTVDCASLHFAAPSLEVPSLWGRRSPKSSAREPQFKRKINETDLWLSHSSVQGDWSFWLQGHRSRLNPFSRIRLNLDKAYFQEYSLFKSTCTINHYKESHFKDSLINIILLPLAGGCI